MTMTLPYGVRVHKSGRFEAQIRAGWRNGGGWYGGLHDTAEAAIQAVAAYLNDPTRSTTYGDARLPSDPFGQRAADRMSYDNSSKSLGPRDHTAKKGTVKRKGKQRRDLEIIGPRQGEWKHDDVSRDEMLAAMGRELFRAFRGKPVKGIETSLDTPGLHEFIEWLHTADLNGIIQVRAGVKVEAAA